MKILLLIFSLFLISGTGESFDVIGYSGGSVLIHSDLPWSSGGVKYLGKTDLQNGACLDIIKDESGKTSIHHTRFSLYNKDGKFTVWIRELDSGLAAKYCFGVKDQRKEIDLKVQTDCCGGRMVMNTHLEETVTIICTYPDTFKENHKLFFKPENRSTIPEIIPTGTETRRDRFSISEDRRSDVLKVTIRDVREDDLGVYYCGVWKEEGSAGYHSLHAEIQLQLTGSSFTIIIITVGICVALLLIGGLAVIIYCVKRKKRQGSTPSSRMKAKDNKQEKINQNTDDASPKVQEPTYSSVSFQKNPVSLTDATATIHTEEPATVYGTVKPSK